MNITIQQETLPNGNILFSILEGVSCSFSSFAWHILSGSTTDIVVGSKNTYIYSGSLPTTDIIWVEVHNFTETYWNGGEFYGGEFSGNFGGGTFHYGQLNDCFYLKQEIKPKPFIEDINKPTGPQSVKPVNTSRLL